VLAKTHIVAGVAAAALAVAWRHDPLTPAVLVLGGLGGLAPDLDHPQALLTRHVPLAPLAAGAAQRLGVVRHRGLLHSFALAAVAAIWLEPALGGLVARVLWALGVGFGHAQWVTALWHLWGGGGAMGFAAGYVSHLLVDVLNTTGVQWLWPLRWWAHLPWPNIPVGTWPETALRWGILAGLGAWHPLTAVWVAVAAEGIYRGVKAV